MKPLPVFNPQNRFETVALDWDDGESESQNLEIYEDQSRTILSTNDSPDVGFKWSVNPYRGCLHACAYCADGDTQILMADTRLKALRDVRVGDAIYGTVSDGDGRRLVRTTVSAQWQSTFKEVWRVTLADGTELRTSGDHRFLTEEGFRHVAKLTTARAFFGFGRTAETTATSPDYERGYLTAASQSSVVEFEAMQRVREASLRAAFEGSSELRDAVGMNVSRHQILRLQERIAWPDAPSREWQRGFLAGIFDAEGSVARHELRMSAFDARISTETQRALRTFGFDASLVDEEVIVPGDVGSALRFAHLVDPAIKRKWDLVGVGIESRRELAVVAVEKLGFEMRMFDITTGTGDFIANGVVSHNCYARPSHEYLSFGAGTDFERKIVVKKNAAVLLREAFDKPKWKGERVVFSGITDCYQPLESKLRLTRACMEVCAEYKNPVGIITKSPVIERDIDVLQQLTRDAHVRVSVSIPFWDRDVAKAMEPVVTTPERRMKIIETLAKAGIRVGVSVSPIVPGLNDDDIGQVLEAAANVGATHAFFVMLRLPGAVKETFERALRTHLPLRAEKVLRRLREMHGGKLYDPHLRASSARSGRVCRRHRDALRENGDPPRPRARRDGRLRDPRHVPTPRSHRAALVRLLNAAVTDLR